MRDRLTRGWSATRKGGRLVLANLLVLLALLVVTNLISGVILSFRSEFKSLAWRVGIGHRGPPPSEYAKLPVYTDKAEARQIWKDFEASIDVEFQPFVEWRREPFESPTTHIGEDRDRYWPDAPTPPPGAPIVRFFGGSATWGTGVVDAETIPAVFSKNRPDYKVFNHGEIAYNTRQNLDRLLNLYAEGRRVDVAVFYEGFNDVLSLCRRDVSLNGVEEEPQMRARLDSANGIGYLLWGKTAELVSQFSQKRRGFICADDPARARAVADTVFRQWELARTLVEAHGGKLIVVLQPVASVGHPDLSYFADQTTPNEPDPEAHIADDLALLYADWQRRAAMDPNDWLYDFSGLFDGDGQLYVDVVHASAAGNQLVALHMAPLIDAALKAR